MNALDIVPAGLSGPAFWLPLIFACLMGLSMLLYVILDGYDLGVGIWLRLAAPSQRDSMIASIGPFWDANETWLVLGVGLLLVAFPLAHGVILGALYLPVALMLVGLILRGVAFDFRAKVKAAHKPLWDGAFFSGSLLASLAQGTMLGQLIVGFSSTPVAWIFSAFIGVGLTAGYALLGASWLILKTEGELQMRAVHWARAAAWGTGAGIAAVSLATPMVSPAIFAKWFSLPQFIALLPIPLISLAMFVLLQIFLARLAADVARGNLRGLQRWAWAPFACSVSLFLMAFFGLAYSLFPYLVPDRITIWAAAAAPESLMIMLYGVILVLPVILGYTAFAYRVFWGKASELRYE
ncbi:MAG: cytochrome d ubiquinol oxidase subunit II [Nevskia sp.]|nr:cytochrome d ubiquinol oxidase subunit II [Nevskia sp.]